MVVPIPSSWPQQAGPCRRATSRPCRPKALPPRWLAVVRPVKEGGGGGGGGYYISNRLQQAPAHGCQREPTKWSLPWPSVYVRKKRKIHGKKTRLNYM